MSSAARQYARSLAGLVDDAEAAGEGLAEASDRLRAAAEQLRTSLQAIEHRLPTGEHDDYLRCSSLLALALDDLHRPRSPLGDALRDLAYLDATLARLATALQMGSPVTRTRTPQRIRPVQQPLTASRRTPPMDASAATRWKAR